MKLNFSTVVELAFLGTLAAGVYLVSGLGWSLVVFGALGLAGAQAYGLPGARK